MAGRRLRLPLPRWLYSTSNQRQLSSNNTAVSPSKKRLAAVVALILFAFVFLIAKIKRGHSMSRMPFTEESTLVLNPTEIGRVWEYEISAGRYPSRRPLPRFVHPYGHAHEPIDNPGLPPSLSGSAWRVPSRKNNTSASLAIHRFRGTGPERTYLPLPEPASFERMPTDARQLSFAPRPLPRSAIDLDVVMAHCDFSLNKYVRDCLEMLRIGAGLDPLQRVRRGSADHWQHLYREEDQVDVELDPPAEQERYEETPSDIMEQLGYRHQGRIGAAGQRIVLQEKSALVDEPTMPTPKQAFVGAGANRLAHPTHVTADPACDPNHPRIFHIFWAGPFSDKPYLATLSFLFTQNLGLHVRMPEASTSFAEDLDPESSERDEFLSQVCRPQLWIWINPGAAASIPNPSARAEMFESLSDNPWSAPFLHPRFEEVIKFKLWNTTEQLDGVPELRDFWRELPLFNSGGVKYSNELGKRKGEALSSTTPVQAVLNATTTGRPGPSPTRAENNKKEDDFYERVGSTSATGYDRLSVVLSDMARFVLCHRFGGVYLDADTIFLRDWEELWGWRGAFAYRWSRLEKYNTAVLKLQRNSAIGSFLFKTALANGLDFHPMTISRYTKDANLEGLLLRLPDALFDPAWLKCVSASLTAFPS
jgi:WD repeat and SOF domain-containing protein 1